MYFQFLFILFIEYLRGVLDNVYLSDFLTDITMTPPHLIPCTNTIMFKLSDIINVNITGSSNTVFILIEARYLLEARPPPLIEDRKYVEIW